MRIIKLGMMVQWRHRHMMDMTFKDVRRGIIMEADGKEALVGNCLQITQFTKSWKLMEDQLVQRVNLCDIREVRPLHGCLAKNWNVG